MKKAFKVTWISLASLVGVIVIVLLIAMYLIFSPKRLTSLVNRYAANFITCDYNIGKVDLTLFKTFPDAGVEINDLVLLNSTKGWTTDTLAAIDECVVSVNIREILFGNKIIINKCLLNGGFINAFFDTEGNNNFDIFPASEPTEDVLESEQGSYLIDLDKLRLNDIELRYTDLATSTIASINGLALKMKGTVNEDVIDGDLSLTIDGVAAEINDTTKMKFAVNNVTVDGKIGMRGDDIKADVMVGTGALAFLMQGENDIAAGFNSFKIKYIGDVNNYDFIKGDAEMSINGMNVVMDGEQYIDNTNISFKSPLACDLEKGDANFETSELRFNDIIISFMGQLTLGEPDITMNMDVSTNTLVINKLIQLIPEDMREELLEGIDVDGKIRLSSHIAGVYNETSMPRVTADVTLNDGYVMMDSLLPYPLTQLNAILHANVNLNGKSDVALKTLRVRMNNSIIAASGSVGDVLDEMLCDLSVRADVDFDDVKTFLPDELTAQGVVKANFNLSGSMEQFTRLDLMNTKLNGELSFNDLNIVYADTINMMSPDMKLSFTLPNPDVNSIRDGLVHVVLEGSDLNADISGMMTAALNDFNINAQVSNVLDSTVMMAAKADFSFSRLDFMMDDMMLHSTFASGSAHMLPSANEGNVSYAAVYSSDSLEFAMGDEMYFGTEAISLNVVADYDEKEDDIYLQWNPFVNIDLSNAVFSMSDMSEQIVIPNIDLNYDEAGLNIGGSRIVLGNSDFNLDGTLTNIYEHFKNNQLLQGEFNFTSSYTDINQLMDIFSGMGSDETTESPDVVTDTTVIKESVPFMVPYGVDIILHTMINGAQVGEMKIKNVGGDLTVKDGILVLSEMGFTSDAAKMQLTAIYKSKRRNHLYAGFDFHLLDIDIAEMIHIMPDLDTIVPMLKSFAGNAEFHFAAETNLKADYSVKYSTLKAACSIEGQDLVVLDGETFNKIKRLLLFSKKTDNKIDSLDVQFTVFKNEIDVYPFAISMDKYSAMLYGRHNLDMSYDYNIAVLSPPILNRLGIEIKGPDLDNMKFKVRRNRHKNMFVPEKRDYKEEKIAELKKIISNSLKENVKPQ